jgi:hypothetical protein
MRGTWEQASYDKKTDLKVGEQYLFFLRRSRVDPEAFELTVEGSFDEPAVKDQLATPKN